jgi:hypothetical protein
MSAITLKKNEENSKTHKKITGRPSAFETSYFYH